MRRSDRMDYRLAEALYSRNIITPTGDATLFKTITRLYPERFWPDADADTLDLLYEARSGQRYVSRLVRNLLVYGDDMDPEYYVDTDGFEKLARALVTYYGASWQRYREVMSLTYDPLDEVDVEEQRSEENEKQGTTTRSGTSTKTDGLTHGLTITETRTGTDAIAHTGTVSTEVDDTITTSTSATRTTASTTEGSSATSNNQTVNSTTTHGRTDSVKDSDYGVNTSVSGDGRPRTSRVSSEGGTTGVTETTTGGPTVTTEEETNRTDTDTGSETTGDEGSTVVTYANTDTETENRQHTTAHTGVDSRQEQETSSGSVSDTGTESLSGTSTTSGRRNRTPAQLITEELDLRRKYYYEYIMTSVDVLLTLATW